MHHQEQRSAEDTGDRHDVRRAPDRFRNISEASEECRGRLHTFSFTQVIPASEVEDDERPAIV